MNTHTHLKTSDRITWEGVEISGEQRIQNKLRDLMFNVKTRIYYWLLTK